MISKYSLADLKPKINRSDIEFYLNDSSEKQIENNEVYRLIEKITDLAYPTNEDQYDKRWEYFYLPIKRGRKTILVPVWIMEYNKEFFAIVESFGNLHITKGEEEIEKFYKDIFSEILDFIPILKKDQKDQTILKNAIPYDIRTGKIKGRYILERLLSQDKKNAILECYKDHIKENLQIKEISLNEYLDVAAICYKAAYQEEAENLSSLQMYKRWADGRDGGMLSIIDWNSKQEFYDWYLSGQHAGTHPFEIVFSWHQHGIHLYPPNSNPYYNLRVTNYAYAWDFIKMAIQLIKAEIPFEAGKIEEVLDFLAGDTYFTVNKRGDNNFDYRLSREYKKKYFPYIEWDEIRVVKWKNNKEENKEDWIQ